MERRMKRKTLEDYFCFEELKGTDIKGEDIYEKQEFLYNELLSQLESKGYKTFNNELDFRKFYKSCNKFPKCNRIVAGWYSPFGTYVSDEFYITLLHYSLEDKDGYRVVIYPTDQRDIFCQQNLSQGLSAIKVKTKKGWGREGYGRRAIIGYDSINEIIDDELWCLDFCGGVGIVLMGNTINVEIEEFIGITSDDQKIYEWYKHNDSRHKLAIFEAKYWEYEIWRIPNLSQKFIKEIRSEIYDIVNSENTISDSAIDEDHEISNEFIKELIALENEKWPTKIHALEKKFKYPLEEETKNQERRNSCTQQEIKDLEDKLYDFDGELLSWHLSDEIKKQLEKLGVSLYIDDSLEYLSDEMY